MTQVNVIIFYEHVKREYDSVCLLKKELSKIGLSAVVLPIHYWKYKYLIKYNPDLIVMPFLYDSRIDAHRLFEKYKGRKLPVINLASEQLLDKQTRKSHLPADEYSRGAYHVAWSRKYADALIEIGVKPQNIIRTGNIRMFEHIKHSLRDENVVKVKKVLVPTSFARSFIAESYIKKIRVDFDEYMRRVEHATSVRDIFFKEIGTLAVNYSDILWSFRPHPNVSISKYKNKLCEINGWNRLPSNVNLITEESIHNSIVAHDVIVSWYSTTIVDSYLMKKNHLVYDPKWDRSYSDNDLFANCDLVSLTDIESCLGKLVEFKTNEFLEDYIDENFTYTSQNSVELLAQEIGNILGKQRRLVDTRNSKERLFGLLYLMFKFLTVDIIKDFLIKIRMLHIFIPFYAGLIEDTKSDERLPKY